MRRWAVPNTVALEIRGELWATLHPEELYIKTEIDLDTGVCDPSARLSRRAALLKP